MGHDWPTEKNILSANNKIQQLPALDVHILFSTLLSSMYTRPYHQN